MIHHTFTACLEGLTPIKIEVEVDSHQGTPGLTLIGLTTKSVDEAKERITSALIQCDVRPRNRRTIVNLAPADVKKTGSGFDLAIAVCLLKTYGEIKLNTDHILFFGELALDGVIKPIKGALPLVLAARALGFTHVVLPQGNLAEVDIISEVIIHPVTHLTELICWAHQRQSLPELKPLRFADHHLLTTTDEWSSIVGQIQAKRALEIAAAGGHNLLMVGPPGAGKSLLAKALIGILPSLTESEAIEVTSLHSLSGLNHGGLIHHRPFRAPHHTTSAIGLLGGGSSLKPGEITLAHRGVLFLDEILEFARPALEALRQPLEDGIISISRAQGQMTYPAAFRLIAAANPCPCGYAGSTLRECKCPDFQVKMYRKKLSGPLLDRIDLQLRVREIKIEELTTSHTRHTESTSAVRKRISIACHHQAARLTHTPFLNNAAIKADHVTHLCSLEPSAQVALYDAAKTHSFSARSYYKIIKVAQTIADLADESIISDTHIGEALQYRNAF